jgi:hypothetical protein
MHIPVTNIFCPMYLNYEIITFCSLTMRKTKMLGRRDAGVLAPYSPEGVNHCTLMDSVLKRELNGVASNGPRN